MVQETQTKDAPTHIELIESYFDENSRDWSELYETAKRVNDLVLADRKNASVAHLAKYLKPGSRILDMGCGAGHTALDLIRLGHWVHGVDISNKMLEHARDNLEKENISSRHFELSNADLLGSELEAESFDAVTALGFLQYQRDEARALQELNRVLKPGGIMVITGPTQRKIANWLGMSRYYYGLRRRVVRLLKPKPASAPSPAAPAAPAAGEEAVLRQISTHAYSYARFTRLIEAADFEVLHRAGHGYVNFEIIGRRIGHKGELFLHRFFTRFAKVIPIGRWANDLIFVARKR